MSRPASSRPNAEPAGAGTVVVHLGDQRRSRTDSHGIINFSLGLVRALPGALYDDERLVVVANEEIAGELGTAWRRPGDELRVVPPPRSTAARLWIDHVGIVRAAAAVGADVVIFPKGFLPVRSRRRSPARWVPCFHDDIPARALRDAHLPVRRRARAAYFTALLRWSLRRADRRLFVSAFTASQLTGSRVARSTDAVIHEGISLPRRPVRPLADRAPQAVVLGSAHPHKRTGVGLDLIGGDPALAAALDRVVVLGALDPARDRTGSLAVDHRPDPLSSAALAELIASSRLLVYPSAYEGFGLPPIEAFALGTPAVFRRTDAAREVLGDLPGGFDTEDPGAFGRAVETVLGLGDDDLARLSARMWADFDWAVVAERVAGALRQPLRM